MSEIIAETETASAAAAPKLPPMPPEIAKAIVAVMSQVTRLGKDAKNDFQKYKYTSVDQFFEMVGPLMAEAGIFTLVLEASMDVERRETTNDRGETKASMWLLANYDIHLYHASGTSCGPISRSIQVPASGAQSYASAMSFVEKYFLRSLFKIPTGDVDDADGHDKRDLPARSGNRTPPKPETPSITDDQMRELGRMITACGKGTWERFATVFEVGRLGDVRKDKYDDCVLWLKGTQEWQSRAGKTADDPVVTSGPSERKNGNGHKTMPNPGKPASAAAQAPQGATGPIDFDAFRAALDACQTLDAANLVFEKEATNRTPQPSDDELSECDNIMREIAAKYYSEAAE